MVFIFMAWQFNACAGREKCTNALMGVCWWSGGMQHAYGRAARAGACAGGRRDRDRGGAAAAVRRRVLYIQRWGRVACSNGCVRHAATPLPQACPPRHRAALCIHTHQWGWQRQCCASRPAGQTRQHNAPARLQSACCCCYCCCFQEWLWQMHSPLHCHPPRLPAQPHLGMQTAQP